MPRLQCIDTDNKRAELVLWKLAQKCPPLKGWLLDKVYDNPNFFDVYDLESPDTTLRDNRELERLGYFDKAKKAVVSKPVVEQFTSS